ncbi:MAG: 23S rRNA (guanosine(2251)-2'-O)-methyltransferase RlmB [Desulfobacterales bacterium]|nr:23S rRNA (guanosine(2251)-2'-O)-methyltransferase RlmB [Desulfobacterales bacterium]
MKTEILYAVHPVAEALKAGRRTFFALYITASKISKRLEKIVNLAESMQIPIKKVSSLQLNDMAQTPLHQGISAKVSPYPFACLSDILSRPESADNPYFLLLLDNIVDPQNMGALIRTAFCVGTDGIIIPKDRSVSATPAVSKASAGALEHVLLAQVTNMVNTIKILKQKGLWIVGMDRKADSHLFSSNLTGSLGIIIGGEQKGIRPLIKTHCDFIVSIPQKGSIDSLNASVAGAVALYEAYRQRNYSAES